MVELKREFLLCTTDSNEYHFQLNQLKAVINEKHLDLINRKKFHSNCSGSLKAA